MKPIYLKQEGEFSYFCCALYAMCNAKRFLGEDTPTPGTPEWEGLVDIVACRHGSAIRIEEGAEALGLDLELIAPGEAFRPPAILTVKNPCSGTALHACLFLGFAGAGFSRQVRPSFDLVGYRTEGALRDHVDPRTIQFPGPPNHRHWNVRLKEQL